MILMKQIKEITNYNTDFYKKVISDLKGIGIENPIPSEIAFMSENTSEDISIIYKYIFNTYCPNYNIKINNLFLNNKNKFHFIMISYNDYHYSYNYKKKSFVKVNDLDILNNLKLAKISIYKDELIPNIKLNMNL